MKWCVRFTSWAFRGRENDGIWIEYFSSHPSQYLLRQGLYRYESQVTRIPSRRNHSFSLAILLPKSDFTRIVHRIDASWSTLRSLNGSKGGNFTASRYFIPSDVPLHCDLFQRKQIDDSVTQVEASSSTRSTRASARLTSAKNATGGTTASSVHKSTNKAVGRNETSSRAPQDV